MVYTGLLTLQGDAWNTPGPWSASHPAPAVHARPTDRPASKPAQPRLYKGYIGHGYERGSQKNSWLMGVWWVPFMGIYYWMSGPNTMVYSGVFENVWLFLMGTWWYPLDLRAPLFSETTRSQLQWIGSTGWSVRDSGDVREANGMNQLNLVLIVGIWFIPLGIEMCKYTWFSLINHPFLIILGYPHLWKPPYTDLI